MDYTSSGRMIKYHFCCKGLKEGDKFDSPAVERFYKKLCKAKQILEKARPPGKYYAHYFTLAMDKFDKLLCDIEQYDKLSDKEIGLAAFLKKSEEEMLEKALK